MTPVYSGRRTFSLALLILAALFIVGYGLFEGHRLIVGPQLSVLSPKDFTATSSPLVTVSGVAKNIAFLTINGAPAYTNFSGEFRETFSMPPGYTVFEVSARDRFGRSVSRQVRVTILNYCPIN